MFVRIFRYCLLPLLLFVLSACGGQGKEQNEEPETAEAQEIRYEYGIPVDSFYIEEGRVEKGESLGKIFHNAGVPNSVVAQLSGISPSEFDVRSLRQGKSYLLFYPLCYDSVDVDADTIPHTPRPMYFVYRKSMTDDVVFHLTDSLHIDVE